MHQTYDLYILTAKVYQILETIQVTIQLYLIIPIEFIINYSNQIADLQVLLITLLIESFSIKMFNTKLIFDCACFIFLLLKQCQGIKARLHFSSFSTLKRKTKTML